MDDSFPREMSKEPDCAGGGCLHGESNKSQLSARLWVLRADTSPCKYVSYLSNCHCYELTLILSNLDPWDNSLSEASG